MSEQLAIPQEQTFAISTFRWGEELPPQEFEYERFGNIVIWGDRFGKRYGDHYEKPNNYPRRFEEMYLKNGNYRRIVEDIARGIAGNGIVVEGNDTEKLQGALLSVGMSHSYLYKLAVDMAMYNGVASTLTWTKGTTAGLTASKLHTVNQIKIARLRAAVPSVDSPIGQKEGYWYTPDWTKVTGFTLDGWREPYKPKFFPLYGLEPKHEASEIVYDWLYNPVSDYYPVPDGQSVFKELQIDNEITAHQLNFINNGMMSSGLIFMPYRPVSTAQNAEEVANQDAERMRKIEQQLKKKLTGTRKAGNVAMIFYDPTVGGVAQNGQRSPVRPEFQNPVETNNDEKFLKLTEMNREKALTGLGVVSQELFGINKATGFTSQSNTLITAEKITENKVYAPKRDVVIKHLNKIAGAFNLDATVTISPKLSFASELTPEMAAAGLVTVNEWREARGLAPLETNDTRDDQDNVVGAEDSDTQENVAT